jgi:hypothetical protein
MKLFKILEIVLESSISFRIRKNLQFSPKSPDANDLAQHTRSCVCTLENPNTLGIYEKVQRNFHDFPEFSRQILENSGKS